jgi:hypothetical protein
MSATAQNIYQRINAVRKAIGYVQKDKSVSAGAAGSYRAVTHDAVTGMVRAALIENGVIIVPSVTSAVFHPKEPDAKQRLYEATYQINFVNMDAPEERISIAVNSHALDNGDKAPGKALSYATKYGILKLFNIETGEDEESRYQQEEFDTVGHVDFILASSNDKELKDRYSAAYTIAQDAKDKDAMKALIAAKDARKSQLQKAAEAQL